MTSLLLFAIGVLFTKKMCVLLITRLLRGVGRLACKLIDHTIWVAVGIQTDRPKSVLNPCVIAFGGFLCCQFLNFLFV